MTTQCVSCDAESMTIPYIDAYKRHLLAAGRSKSTVRGRGSVLLRADAALPRGLLRATTSELETWLAEPGWIGWTLWTYHMHLRGFYAWACGGRAPMLDWNPMTEVSRPAVPRCVPDPVTGDQLAIALRRSTGLWRLAITLAAYAGLRVDEMARLERRDITQDTVRVRIGKGGQAGVVPTHQAVWALVRGLPAGRLLIRRSGRPVPDGNWLSRYARAHFDQLGMPDVHLHRFRHWFGTTIQRSQGNLRVTQEALRHASATSTVGYTLVTDEQRRQAVTALPTLTSLQLGSQETV